MAELPNRGVHPMRRADDHNHPEYWTEDAHHRFESRTATEMERLRVEVEKVETKVGELTTRITLMLGALGLIAFLLPIISPFVRLWLNLETPPQN
jgi:hypothetical protein